MTTITLRPDPDSERALEALTRDGTSVSDAVRVELIESAAARVRAELRAEAEAIAADPKDRAEAAQVLKDVETWSTCVRPATREDTSSAVSATR